MNLYSISKNNKIKRISVTQVIQKQLADIIDKDADKFESTGEKIVFDGQYKPEDNEILVIKNFSYQNISSFAISSDLLTDKEIDEIKAIVFYFHENKIAFQNFDSRKIIKPNAFNLIYSQNTFSKLDNKGVVIDSGIDALLLNGTLYFKSFFNVSKIFDLSEYYREATDKELDKLREMSGISFKKINDYQLFDSRMRRKIYLITKNDVIRKVIDNYDKVKKYARNIGIGDFFDDRSKKITFPNDKDRLKILIDFLNDDLFKSEITGEIYETNSKIKKKL